MQNNPAEFAKLHKSRNTVNFSPFYSALLCFIILLSNQIKLQKFRFREPYILLLDVTAMDKQQSPYTSEEEEEKNESFSSSLPQ
jgi:hypothetical protein